MRLTQLGLSDALQKNVLLGKYTAARLGGAADWLYIAKSDESELIRVVQAAWADGLPVRVIGGGANILVADSGVRGLVVINRIAEIAPHPPTPSPTRGEGENTGVRNFSIHPIQPTPSLTRGEGENALSVAAGTSLTSLSRKCQSMGLRGFEWAVAVPGTLGGAVINNAGAHGGDTAACVIDVRVLEPDGVRDYTHADLQYAYRHSTLKSRADRQFVVLGATLRFEPDDPDAIQARMDEYNAYRKRTQPAGASLGSVFKNPPGDSAGRLIESAGLKGLRVGSAAVSEKHANFIVNDDAAGSADDYHQLVRRVQAEVLARFGVQLEAEIEFIGDFEGRRV